MAASKRKTYDLTTVAGRIRYCRKRAELTQGQLSELVGLSPGAVNQWEVQDCVPVSENLEKLAQIFGVTVGWLLVREGDDSKAESVQPLPMPSATGLSPMHQASVDLFASALRHGLISNSRCLALMTEWQLQLDELKSRT